MDRTDLMSRARTGDGDAFRELTEPYRRELQVHCYRMLGSYSDAEDALQDTLLAAWQGVGGFEERASLRTWLYRIATNKCLDARRSAGRRPAKEWDVPNVRPLEPTRLGEVVWLEPFPDALLSGAIDVPLGPEARYEQTESVSLAFVTALQALPPRQVAVLILRDVLGFHASEVAGMLDSTVESVTSALKRARATLQRRLPPAQDREPAPAAGSPAENAIVAKFITAWESADLDALVALLTDDVFISMPPIPFEYQGREVAARFCAGIFTADRRFDLVPTRANGQPAFGAYLRAPDGISHGVGLYVLTLTGGRIRAMTRFENAALPWFGLPRSLPARPPRRLLAGGAAGEFGDDVQLAEVPRVLLHEVQQDPLECRGWLSVPAVTRLPGLVQVVALDDRCAARRLLGLLVQQVVECLLRRHVPAPVPPIAPGVLDVAPREPPLQPAHLHVREVLEQLQRRPPGWQPAGAQFRVGQRAQLGGHPVAEEVEVPQEHFGPRRGRGGRLRERDCHDPRLENFRPAASTRSAAEVDDTEQVALGVGEDDEAGAFRIGPVDPGGAERDQACDLGLLLLGAVGVQVKVRHVGLVERDRDRRRLGRDQHGRAVRAVAAVPVRVPEGLTPEL
jgi:RNA polymerase sigma-70 factor (TIGR02960 family)